MAGNRRNGPIAGNGDAFGLQERINTDKASDECIDWRIEKARRHVGLLYAALVHDGHTIGKAKRFILIMRHQNEGCSRAFVEPSELVAHLLTQPFVQTGQGFVEQKDTRFHDERPGKSHTLALTTRENIDIAIGKTGELDELKRSGLIVARAG